jgi:adenylate cyclase
MMARVPLRRAEGGDDVVATLRELGIPADAIQRAVESGDPERAIFEAVLMPAVASRTHSASDIESAGGLPVAEIIAMMEAFGLPGLDPAKPAFTNEEARVFRELASFQDVWPLDLRLQLSRVYGRLLARIAHTEVQLFRTYVEPRVGADAEHGLDRLRAVQATVARLLPLADLLVTGVHRRWVEHELRQAAVVRAEAGVGGDRLPGGVDVTVLFCDLKDFTAYTDLAGDAAAVRAIDQLTEVVMRERGEHAWLIKSIGDGYMLCYPTAEGAVTAGTRIVAAMRDADGPGVHASVHRGTAIAREGDYFGSAVNLAARLLSAAGQHELVATISVVNATGGSFLWEATGLLRLRGFSDPIEAFRLVR